MRARHLAAAIPRSKLDRSRRRLQVALGVIWLIDAGLQYQPFMFGRGFVTHVIEPAAHGNPAPLAHSMLWAAHVLAAHLVPGNMLFATAQLALAIGLLWPRTVKLALAATVLWSLGVWWFGEGLGGILAGSANPLTGAPGAAVLYALLAVLAWPSKREGRSVAAASVLRRAAIAAWIALWGSEAYFALALANDSRAGLRDALAGAASSEPPWLSSLDRWAASTAPHHSVMIGTGLAASLAFATIAVLAPRGLVRPLLAITILLSMAIWIIPENLGGILTGQSTDPNSGPLLILLVLAYWPIGAAYDLGPPGGLATRPLGRPRRPHRRHA